jgi:predicted DNA-binding protein
MTSNNTSIERYVNVRLSETQYQVLQTICKAKAMTIDQYCRWAFIQGLEDDIELHFAKDAKDRLLDGLDNKEGFG